MTDGLYKIRKNAEAKNLDTLGPLSSLCYTVNLSHPLFFAVFLFLSILLFFPSLSILLLFVTLPASYPRIDSARFTTWMDVAVPRSCLIPASSDSTHCFLVESSPSVLLKDMYLL